MRFGIFAKVEAAGDLRAAGADFVEENVQQFLQGSVEDAQWAGRRRVENLPLPLLAANSLVPGDLKIVGPRVDLDALRRYMGNVSRRAGIVGMKILVFGSAGARNVPEGFDRDRAREQIIQFARMAADLCAEHGITLVAEPLNRGESNIINSVTEAVGYVAAVNHPNFKALVDSYHFWLEEENLESLRSAMPAIWHVHVADKEGRVPPGESGKSDYRPFFRVLKDGGYSGLISVESPGFHDFQTVAPRVVSFLRKQWEEA
jgi:sugar phosphate isomerase/epimerase